MEYTRHHDVPSHPILAVPGMAHFLHAMRILDELWAQLWMHAVAVYRMKAIRDTMAPISHSEGPFLILQAKSDP